MVAGASSVSVVIRARQLSVAVVVLAVSSCSASSRGTTSTTPEKRTLVTAGQATVDPSTLAGSLWDVQSIDDPHGHHTTTSYVPILHFAADNRSIEFDSCNADGGGIRVGRGTMTTGGLGGTLIGCGSPLYRDSPVSPKLAEDDFLALFRPGRSVSWFVASDGTLHLGATSERVRMLFAKRTKPWVFPRPSQP